MTELHEPPIAGNETDALLGSLERIRRTLAWKTGGLDDAGLKVTVGASSSTHDTSVMPTSSASRSTVSSARTHLAELDHW